MQWVFDRRDLRRAASQLSLVSSGADGMPEQSNDDLIELALAILRDVTPEAREATLRHGLVVRERRATFSVAPDAPPRPPIRPRPGLFLAGDWIGTEPARYDRGRGRERPRGRAARPPDTSSL